MMDLLLRLWGLSFGTACGFALALATMRRARLRDPRAEAARGATVVWEDRVVGAWRQDALVGAFLLLHGGTVVALGVMAATAALAGPARSPWWAQTADVLTGILAGTVLGFPFARRVTPTAPMAMLAGGVRRGLFALPWRDFSHYRADPRTRIIRLYSPVAPEVARAAWWPPAERYDEVVAELARHLPEAPPPTPVWYRRRMAFIGSVVLLAGIALGVGWFVLHTDLPFTSVYCAAAAYVVTTVGVRLIESYAV